jgi:hypothetical protein
MMLGGAVFLLTSKTRKQVILWIAVALIPSYIVMMGATGPGAPANYLPLRVFWIVALSLLVVLYWQQTGKRLGAKIPAAALAIVVAYLGVLAGVHSVAVRAAEQQAATIANGNSENVVKVAAMPTAANPTQWICVMETDRATYRFDLSLLQSPPASANPPNLIRYEKPIGSDAKTIAKAEGDSRARIFLGFARFPVMRVTGADCVTQSLVQFADLRYTEPGRGRGTFSLDVPVECPALERP